MRPRQKPSEFRLPEKPGLEPRDGNPSRLRSRRLSFLFEPLPSSSARSLRSLLIPMRGNVWKGALRAEETESNIVPQPLPRVPLGSVELPEVYLPCLDSTPMKTHKSHWSLSFVEIVSARNISFLLFGTAVRALLETLPRARVVG